jgi:plastocyanin
VRRRVLLLVAAAGVLAAAVAACGGAPPPVVTPPADAVVVTAQGTAFTTQYVTAPADVAFTLWFDNMDNELHNVHIWDATNASVFAGEAFTGPGARGALVPPLTPGAYHFTCDIHPGMTGQLVAG